MLRLTDVAGFGQIGAEDDLALPSYFVRTAAFRVVIRQERHIVVGRKGTGKTALYIAIETAANPQTAVMGLDFSDYPWPLHDDALNSTSSQQEKYVNSWYFLMLIELAKLVIQGVPKASDEGAKALHDFIVQNWGAVDFHHRDFYRKDEYEITGDYDPQVAGTSVGNVTKRKVPRQRLGNALTGTLRWLEEVLSGSLHRDVKYFLMFDELDRGFSPRDEAYRYRLTGLLLAAQRLASWSDSRGTHARAVIFLRSDIFDTLQFSDKNKIRDSSVVGIGWTDRTEGDDNLVSLMRQRIRYATPGLPAEADPWLAMFPADRGPERPMILYKRMINQTYIRPRDIIKFANLALGRAKDRIRHSAGGPQCITPEDVRSAELAFSTYLVDELDDEISATEPEWKTYLELLRRVGRSAFTRAELVACLAEIESPPPAHTILGLLYKFGLIGFATRGRAEVLYRHRRPAITLDPKAESYQVHPGLRVYLDMAVP
jgi:hypothetical protein